MRKTVASTVAWFPMFLAVALACRCAVADQMVYTAKERKSHQNRPLVDHPFRSYADGIITHGIEVVAVDIAPRRGGNGQFGAFGLGQQGGQATKGTVPLKAFEVVKFDGKDDWLTVVMKNGDIVRGFGETMTPTALRLKGVEKPLRMLTVKEITATEPPAEPAAEQPSE
jgi:hypothetical protein